MVTLSPTDRRETFERAAIVARDYSAMAARIFRGNKCDAAELADQIVKNEVALDGGVDLVLLRDEDPGKQLRRLRILEVSTDRLPETVLVDVTSQVGDEPHVDGWETITWHRDGIRGGRIANIEIRCEPKAIEVVEGRVLLTLGVEWTVKS